MGEVTRIGPSHRTWRIGITSLIPCLAVLAPTSEPLQTAFSYDALNARIPVVRQESYVVNARVRPLLLFWIGRDNVGDARLTWRAASGDRRAFELLIGSDPVRAPRQINRWGFIVEELNPGRAEVLGLMKESNEETIEAAEEQIGRKTDTSVFKAARTTISGGQAVSRAMTVHAPSNLTYRELDSLLALIPAEPRSVGTLELPSGTQSGFLVAMDALLQASVTPCQSRSGGAKAVSAIPYVYARTIFDLSLLSCTYEPELRTKTNTFADVVEGRFQVRNRTTKYETRFHVSYGTSGKLRGLPVKAVFRPRWWMEIELLLDRSNGSADKRSTQD